MFSVNIVLNTSMRTTRLLNVSFKQNVNHNNSFSTSTSFLTEKRMKNGKSIIFQSMNNLNKNGSIFFQNSKNNNNLKLFSTSSQTTTEKRNDGLKTDGKYRSYAASLSTYFKLEEQGMKDFEMLSRASLFLVASQKIGYKKRLHLIGTAHVTHPWSYLDFFPEERDWLQFVNENATKNVMEIRETQTGKTLLEFELEPQTYKHPKLDLVVLHLKDEEKFWQTMKESQQTLHVIPLSNQPMQEKRKVVIVGHNYEKTLENKLIPLYTEGNVNLEWQEVYGFVRTNGVCPMGVCGGPVLAHAHSPDGNHYWESLGVVAAVVMKKENPAEDSKEFFKAIEDNALCVGSKQILSFLDEIEHGEVEPSIHSQE